MGFVSATEGQKVIALELPQFSAGSLSVLKWLALVLMTLDHIDAAFFGRSLGWPTQLGRLVFPIFGFVLAYNLARPQARASGTIDRTLQRLTLFAAFALAPHWLLFGEAYGFPVLNVIFTFAAFVLIVGQVEKQTAAGWLAAGAIFVAGGALVEYWWPGLLFCLAVYWAYRGPLAVVAIEHVGDWWSVTGRWAPLAVLAAACSLSIANGTHAALWALPVIWLASGLDVELPRLRWAFYAYYPIHLGALLAMAP